MTGGIILKEIRDTTLINCAIWMPSGGVVLQHWVVTCINVILVERIIKDITLVETGIALCVRIHKSSNG